MIYLDSDSDSGEDLIPSVKKFGELFATAQRLACQPEPSTTPRVSTPSDCRKRSKVVKSKTPKKVKKVCAEGKRNPEKDKPVLSKTEEIDTGLSKDTVNLLAEIDALTASLPKIVGGCLRYAPDESKGQSQKTSNGRKRHKSGDVEPITISSDDGDDIQELLDVDSANGFNYNDDILMVEEDIYYVRIRWISDILKFQFSQGTKFSTVKKSLADRVSLPVDDLIILNELSEEIPEEFSVDNLKFGSILEAFKRIKETPSQSTTNAPQEKVKPVLDPINYIKLKVQGSGGYRQRIEVFIKRTAHFNQLIDIYKEKFNLQGKNYRLMFDGDPVVLSETPEFLDLDGGEIFDIIEVSNK